MNRDTGQGAKGSEVKLLAGALSRIVGSRLNLGRKISDRDNIVFGQKVCTERFNVQPAHRRALQTAIVKVESIHINKRFHGINCVRECSGHQAIKPVAARLYAEAFRVIYV